jgi:hypothetical protein
MSTSAAEVPSADLRPTDIAWAQQLIADLHADAALRQRWQQAEAAFCWADAHQTSAPTPEQSTLLLQLIHIGQALGEDTTRLSFVWDHGYAPISSPAAEVDALHLRIFGEPRHAA